MEYTTFDNQAFLARVESWIKMRDEVLVMFRYRAAAGSKDFMFFSDMDAFRSRLKGLYSQTSIIVFRDPQLPLRGRVDEDLVMAALDLIPEGAEYLVLCLEKMVESSPPDHYREWFRHYTGESQEELRDDLEGLSGKEVAVGPYPTWPADNESAIEAFVPTENGVVMPDFY